MTRHRVRSSNFERLPVEATFTESMAPPRTAYHLKLATEAGHVLALGCGDEELCSGAAKRVPRDAGFRARLSMRNGVRSLHRVALRRDFG